MFFFHIIELRISNNFSISIFTFLHFYKCYARIFYCNSRTGMIQFIRLTECSARGAPCAAVRICDDENQIARESVFRAERIPERIDRPCPYSVQIRAVSILSEGLVQHAAACPFSFCRISPADEANPKRFQQNIAPVRTNLFCRNGPLEVLF